jgi:hypothetical protein
MHVYLQLRIISLRQGGIPKSNVTPLAWQGKIKLLQLPLVLLNSLHASKPPKITDMES